VKKKKLIAAVVDLHDYRLLLDLVILFENAAVSLFKLYHWSEVDLSSMTFHCFVRVRFRAIKTYQNKE
jgi:hypothetical protein